MKKLHLLILRSFVGPFTITFVISLFFLIMQWLWKYVDDLMGKGLEWYTVMELLFYASSNLIPMALPMAILFSSIMIFGNLGESNELTAMKSAGLSLFKIMRPLLVVMLFLSFGAFLFSNYVWPVANLKFKTLLYDIQQSKPALNLKEGIFYTGIDGYSIKVENKNGQVLEDVHIIDHTNKNDKYNKDIRAEKGKMLKSEDDGFLVLQLFDGMIYEDIDPRSMPDTYYPYQTYEFEKATVRFDLSSFKLHRNDEEMFKSSHEMLNITQLNYAIDSLIKFKDEINTKTAQHLTRKFRVNRDSTIQYSPKVEPENFLKKISIGEKLQAYTTAINALRNNKKYVASIAETNKMRENFLGKHYIEWHRKFTLSLSVIVLFFIGAPLGAIIKRGGFGAPVVFSVLLFLLYYVISISGEKMAKSAVLTPFWGMWLSSVILLPIGVYLTYKAASDAPLINSDIFRKFNSLFKKGKKDKDPA